jgi:hypothetical protein
LSRSTSNSRSRFRVATEDLAPLQWLKQRWDSIVLRRWVEEGRPVPPPHAFKRTLVRSIAHSFPAKVFVETGTFYGDMVSAVIDDFRRIISIELSPSLHQLARRRFRARRHVTLFLGDSSVLLPQIVTTLTEPCVFWLDAHHSGTGTAVGSRQTPILDELNAILTCALNDHVVLVDDARCFVGADDYPCLEDIRALLAAISDRYELAVSDDVIHIWPKAWAHQVDSWTRPSAGERLLRSIYETAIANFKRERRAAS